MRDEVDGRLRNARPVRGWGGGRAGGRVGDGNGPDGTSISILASPKRSPRFASASSVSMTSDRSVADAVIPQRGRTATATAGTTRRAGKAEAEAM